MDSPEILRQRMVKCQLMPENIQSQAVLQAFGTIPREPFPTREKKVELAYQDGTIDLDEGRSLTRPGLLAKLIELANPTPADKVLYLGAMTGYGAFIMGLLSHHVVALEESVLLYTHMEHNLKQVDVPSIDLHLEPLAEGFQPSAPYDLIFIEGAIASLPNGLVEQIAPKGRMVGVWEETDGDQYAFTLQAPSRSQTPYPQYAFQTQMPLLPGFSKKNHFAF